jgi:hypothetical protein
MSLKFQKLDILLWFVFFSLCAISIGGSQLVGMSWDEPFHAARLAERLSYGINLPFSDFTSPSYAALGDYYVHGLGYQFLAHSFNFLIGNENWYEVSNSTLSMEGRHLISSLLGIATAVLVGLIVKLLTGDLRTGLLGSIFLLSFPVFNGHSMFNPKDIPVAFALTLCAFVLLHILKNLDKSHVTIMELCVIFLLNFIWIFLGVGTRLGLWVFAAIYMFFLGIFYFRSNKKLKNYLKYLCTSILGMFFGFMAVLLLHSDQLTNITNFFVRSIKSSSNFNSGSLLVYLGQVKSPPSDRFYLISNIIAHTPIYVFFLFLILITLIGLNLASFKKLFLKLWLEFLIIFSIGILPIIYAISVNADSYDTDRHFLFIYPFFSIIITLAFYYVIKISKVFFLNLFKFFFGVFFSISIIAQLSLFPYTYVYVNELGLVFNNGKEINGWETDYWGISLREAQESLAQNTLLHCSSNKHFAINRLDLQFACDSNILPSNTNNYVFIAPHRENYSPPYNCSEFQSTKRSLFGYSYRMNFVYSCPDPFNTDGGIFP